MNRIAYYLFVLPLSYLPLYLLYGLSPIIYFICYYVISYRKNIVRLNIQNSFPEKTAKELKTDLEKVTSTVKELETKLKEVTK